MRIYKRFLLIALLEFSIITCGTFRFEHSGNALDRKRLSRPISTYYPRLHRQIHVRTFDRSGSRQTCSWKDGYFDLPENMNIIIDVEASLIDDRENKERARKLSRSNGISSVGTSNSSATQNPSALIKKIVRPFIGAVRFGVDPLVDAAKSKPVQFLQYQILRFIDDEFQVTRKEVLMMIPVIFRYESPEFSAWTTKLPTSLRHWFVAAIRVDRFFRYIGVAIRESISITLDSAITTQSATPLVRAIVESVLKDFEMPSDTRTYLNDLHQRIMAKFDSDGLDDIINYYATSMSYFGAEGLLNFFELVLSPLPDSGKFIHKLRSIVVKPDSFHEKSKKSTAFTRVNMNAPSIEFSESTKLVAKGVLIRLSSLPFDDIAILIMRLLFVIGDLMKIILRSILSFPLVRSELKAFFERNLLRAYNAAKPDMELPKPACHQNKHLNNKNVWNDKLNLEQRKAIVKAHEEWVKSEAFRREYHRANLDAL